MKFIISVTGCPLRPGDLLGSGTISGPIDGSFGPDEVPNNKKSILIFFYKLVMTSTKYAYPKWNSLPTYESVLNFVSFFQL